MAVAEAARIEIEGAGHGQEILQAGAAQIEDGEAVGHVRGGGEAAGPGGRETALVPGILPIFDYEGLAIGIGTLINF